MQIADQYETDWFPDTGVSHHMTANATPLQGMHHYSGSSNEVVGMVLDFPFLKLVISPSLITAYF